MCLIELTSCGEDTSSWPTYELPFECKQITCIELSFIEKPYKKIIIQVPSLKKLRKLMKSYFYMKMLIT